MNEDVSGRLLHVLSCFCFVFSINPGLSGESYLSWDVVDNQSHAGSSTCRSVLWAAKLCLASTESVLFFSLSISQNYVAARTEIWSLHIHYTHTLRQTRNIHVTPRAYGPICCFSKVKIHTLKEIMLWLTNLYNIHECENATHCNKAPCLKGLLPVLSLSTSENIHLHLDSQIRPHMRQNWDLLALWF